MRLSRRSAKTKASEPARGNRALLSFIERTRNGLSTSLRMMATGRGIRVLAIIDAFTRECLTLGADTGFSSERVTRSLEQIVKRRGVPHSIRRMVRKLESRLNSWDFKVDNLLVTSHVTAA